MKFRDGMWLTAEGMGVSYAEEVYNIKKTSRGLSLLCPTRKIRSRGDSLNLPTLTIVCASPAEEEHMKFVTGAKYLAGHRSPE